MCSLIDAAKEDYMQHRYAEAEQKLRGVLQCEPRNADARQWLARTLFAMRRYREARAEACQALDDDSELAIPHTVLGWVHALMEKRLTEAEREFKKAVALAPDLGWARASLGWLYARQGRYAEAEGELRKAVELDPLSSAGYENLGYVYLRQRRSCEAITILRQAIAINSREPVSHMSLAAAYSDERRFGDALEEYKLAFRLRPSLGAFLGLVLSWTACHRFVAPVAIGVLYVFTILTRSLLALPFVLAIVMYFVLGGLAMLRTRNRAKAALAFLIGLLTLGLFAWSLTYGF